MAFAPSLTTTNGEAVKVSVIIPTITGREVHLDRCVRAYRRTVPRQSLELIVIENEPSCGHAWAKGAEQATGDFIHFTADDLQPRGRWLRSAIETLAAGVMPAAIVGDRKDALLTCDSPLGDMGTHPNILVPFFSRALWEQGDWVLPCHYGTDDWITYLAVKRGMSVRQHAGYVFRHWVAQEGRDYSRRLGDVEILVEAMSKAGYVPPVYQSLVEGLRVQYGKPGEPTTEPGPKPQVKPKSRVVTPGSRG